MCICDEITKLTQIECESFDAKDITTFKGGGAIKHAFVPKNMREFLNLLCAFEVLGAQTFLLGGGSNVLIMDGVVDTPVIYTKNLNKIRIANGMVFAECGAKIGDIARIAREYALGGLEFAAGVPLSLGGALKMNASAFGHGICDVVESVFVFSSRAHDMRERDSAHTPVHSLQYVVRETKKDGHEGRLFSWL